MTDTTTFAINLNEKYTTIADVKSTSGGIQLDAMGFEMTTPFYYSSDNQTVLEKQAEVIAKLHSNLRIKKRNVAVVIPDIYTFSRVVEMPRLKEKELLAAIRYQADEFIPMNIDDTNLDLEILKEDPKNNKVLIFIVASPKKVVEKIQKTVELADLSPTSLENELSAVARLMSNFMKKATTPAGTTILMNIGYSSTSLYLFDETNTCLLLSRTFQIGLSLFIKDIVANLNIDEAKATEALQKMGADPHSSLNLESIISPIIKEIAREVERFILISKEKYALPVSSIYSFNFDSAIAYLTQKLQTNINIPVSSLPLSTHIAESPLKNSFSNTLSSFVSVIAGAV